ncbi:ATPase, T2SS/T4P/T4SS family [Desulfosporosinus sp. FKA]|uniref:ATPase, T2SS/T4P/T4SS family n=1 Tax=Desulfosporosinus sp. FKA TaxID=1969834 RepID=UPI000B4A3171|nr:ATPase, T2SS/T4P/T4SS family [Desulfosporosinus sp. FKA]
MNGYNIKIKPRPQIDVERVKREVERQRAYQEKNAGGETAGIALQADFLGEESPESLMNKSVSLESIYDDVYVAEREVYEEISRKYGHLLDGDQEARETELPIVVANLVAQKDLNVEEKRFVFQRVANRYVGYDILQPLVADTRITEFGGNSYKHLWIEIDGLPHDIGPGTDFYPEIQFPDAHAYEEYIRKLYGKTKRSLDKLDCLVRAELPDGSRLSVTWPLVVRVPVFSIRKTPDTSKRYTSQNYIQTGAATEEMMELSGLLTEGLCNGVALGATGSTKTTFLRIMLEEHTLKERVFGLGDNSELNPLHPHYIPMQTVKRDKNPIGIDELIEQVLTMRPDRIIMEEMRKAVEAGGFMKIISHGHDGVLCTGHSKNPWTFENLMVVWLQENGMKVEERFVRQMLHDALDWLVFFKRSNDDGTRKIITMWEVLPYDPNSDGYNLLYYYDFKQKKHIQRGKLQERTCQRCLENGIIIPEKFIDHTIGGGHV